MKRKLLIVSVLLMSSMFAVAQSWIDQNTFFPSEFSGVDHMSCPQPGVAWITAYDGTGQGINLQDLSITVDGGITWNPGVVIGDTTYKISNICALNADTAWVAAFDNIVQTGGGIWQTTDGGVSWNAQGVDSIFDSNSFPDFVYFWNADTGVAVGDPNGPGTPYFEIYTTVNGGVNWTRTPSANIPVALTSGPGEAGIIDYFDVFDTTIWFTTDRGRIYKSVDKGLTWTVKTITLINSVTPDQQSMRVRFLDDQNGLAEFVTNATGVIASVKRTFNGGTTWSAQVTPTNFFTSDFGRIPGSGMYMSTGGPAGNTGSSYSVDSGATWIKIDTIQYNAFKSYDINNTWAGTFNFFDASFNNLSGISKFDSASVVTGVKEVNLKAQVSAYPNPSTGIVHMNFKIGKALDLKATVVNMIGDVVYSEKFSNVTLFDHRFDFTYLPKGIYVLNLEYGQEHTAQKLVIQ